MYATMLITGYRGIIYPWLHIKALTWQMWIIQPWLDLANYQSSCVILMEQEHDALINYLH